MCIRDRPVVERIGVADAAAGPLAYPPFSGEPMVVAVAVNRAPAVEALLRADADQMCIRDRLTIEHRNTMKKCGLLSMFGIKIGTNRVVIMQSIV